MANKLDRGSRSRSSTRKSLQAPRQEMVRGGGEGSGVGKADGFDSASWDECCSKLSLALGQ